MKVPISKQLTENLILFSIAITAVGLYDLYSSGQKHWVQNWVFICAFGIPTGLFAWFLLDKSMVFKDNKKVRKENRLFQLPFSSFSTIIILIISTFFLVAGLALIFGDKNMTCGLLMLFTGLFSITLTAIAIDHPQIWFSDTLNLEDLMEEVKHTSPANSPAYSNNIFSFQDNFFTIQLDHETKTIYWDEITLIKAYKIDQLTFDCIIIEIHLSEKLISISDQTSGYMKFMEVASNKLLNFKKDWFMVVAFPAFKTNLTIIYERQIEQEVKI